MTKRWQNWDFNLDSPLTQKSISSYIVCHYVDKVSQFLNFSTSNTPLSDAVVWQRNPKTIVCGFRVDLSTVHGIEQPLQSRPWEFQEILSQWDEFQGPPPLVT